MSPRIVFVSPHSPTTATVRRARFPTVGDVLGLAGGGRNGGSHDGSTSTGAVGSAEGDVGAAGGGGGGPDGRIIPAVVDRSSTRACCSGWACSGQPHRARHSISAQQNAAVVTALPPPQRRDADM